MRGRRAIPDSFRANAPHPLINADWPDLLSRATASVLSLFKILKGDKSPTVLFPLCHETYPMEHWHNGELYIVDSRFFREISGKSILSGWEAFVFVSSLSAETNVYAEFCGWHCVFQFQRTFGSVIFNYYRRVVYFALLGCWIIFCVPFVLPNIVYNMLLTFI